MKNRIDVVIALATLCLSTVIFATTYVSERQKTLRKIQDEKYEIVNKISVLIGDRVSRARLLKSAFDRNTTEDEIKSRKKKYDESYHRWNAEHHASLLKVRSLVKGKHYRPIEMVIEQGLVQGYFKPLDSCLTLIYDQKINNNLSASQSSDLENCDLPYLINGTMSCAFVVTEALYSMVRLEEPIEEAMISSSAFLSCADGN